MTLRINSLVTRRSNVAEGVAATGRGVFCGELVTVPIISVFGTLASMRRFFVRAREAMTYRACRRAQARIATW